MKMKITVTESTVVTPAEATPATCLWTSNLDLVMPPDFHVPCAYFYRSNGSANFFDSAVLKSALSQVLVHFYPVAGRLTKSDDGRLEINCNGEGVLFVEAESDGVMDELGDFDPRPDLRFSPSVDYSKGISSYPIFLAQVTRFKCGGVCLVTATEHRVADGISALHFISSWSGIARGLDKVAIPPFLDRKAVLSARDPPQPKFAHIEYQPPPSLRLPQDPGTTTIFKKFRLTHDQMNALVEKCKDNVNGQYSTYEVLCGHVWRCVCIARGLLGNQETWLWISVDGRKRLVPPLPQGYFGNVIFHTSLVLSAGEVQSNPPEILVAKIHETIARMDEGYLRSAIDSLQLLPDIDSVYKNVTNVVSPNLAVIGWTVLPLYDADFGWGEPIYVGLALVLPEGMSHVLPTNDGSILYGISLPRDQMDVFEKLFHCV